MPTPTSTISIQGREFTITHDQPVADAMETPYLLTPKARRGAQDNFRLVRNGPNPQMLFPIGNKPMSAGGLPKWWVRETVPGVIIPA